MTYVIGATCIDAKDQSCIDACPAECIHGDVDDRMLYIDPDECIDCEACVKPCPVDAIYAEEDLPADWQEFITINSLWFKDKFAARVMVDSWIARN
ncbi:MAG: 4Fe-4S dicluster domain-containing protein [Acidimicrobiales bacterium]